MEEEKARKWYVLSGLLFDLGKFKFSYLEIREWGHKIIQFPRGRRSPRTTTCCRHMRRNQFGLSRESRLGFSFFHSNCNFFRASINHLPLRRIKLIDRGKRELENAIQFCWNRTLLPWTESNCINSLMRIFIVQQHVPNDILLETLINVNVYCLRYLICLQGY